MSQLTYIDVLQVIECGHCRITFAIPENMDQARRKDGQNFWCPNGDRISYGNDENSRLKRRLEQAEARERHKADQLEASERSRIATKGHLTRARKRAVNGICPCCKRTFSNVVEHMKSQHPDEVAANS